MRRRDGLPLVYTHPRYWTEAERLRVTLLVEEGLPDSAIAAATGRSENAVHVFAARHLQKKRRGGIAGPGCRPLSGRAAARLMGIGCSKTVARWVRLGWLRGHRKLRAAAGRRVSVQYSDLLAFLENPEHWHRWRPAEIADHKLQRFVASVRDVRWLTPGQVASRFFVQPGAVNDWIHRGLLPPGAGAPAGVRKWGNWWIAETALEGFVPPYARSRAAQPRRPQVEEAA